MEFNTLTKRREKAEYKAMPLIVKYGKMNVEETLKFLRENPLEWKKDHNIINRFYNLVARENGYAKGIKQFTQKGCGENMYFTATGKFMARCGNPKFELCPECKPPEKNINKALYDECEKLTSPQNHTHIVRGENK